MQEVKEIEASEKDLQEAYIGAVGFGMLSLLLVASLIIGCVKENKSSNMLEKSKIELVNKANPNVMRR